jgi:diaminopimelate decarboxylase
MRTFGTMEVKENLLWIGGVSSQELVKEYGSPLYVMDQHLIEENMNKFKKGFKSSKFETEVIYASKAFLTMAMCQLVAREGLSMDAVSGGEIFTAREAGFPMENIYFHGNNKGAAEITLALKSKVGTIIVDNPGELDLLEQLCIKNDSKIRILLRVNPGIEAHTHEYIQTSKYCSKFGESIFDDKTEEFIKKVLKSQHITLEGFHCHIGSQIFGSTPYLAAIDTMVEFVAKIRSKTGYSAKVLNMGGGFGIYYSKEDDAMNIEDITSTMIEHLEEKIDEYQVEVEKVLIEPGRSIVANAGTTLYRVGGLKTTYSEKKYVFIDGGMTDNIRPALYQADYEGSIANRMNDSKTELVTVAGKCCESGDIIMRDTLLQRCQVDDILAVGSTGAYNYSMASNYNRITKPAVVFVKAGESKVVVKRETYMDLIRNDIKLY